MLKKIKEEWNLSDIMDYAQQNLDVKMTKEEAANILAAIHHNYDANQGISWDIIDDAIQQKKKGEGKNKYPLPRDADLLNALREFFASLHVRSKLLKRSWYSSYIFKHLIEMGEDAGYVTRVSTKQVQWTKEGYELAEGQPPLERAAITPLTRHEFMSFMRSSDQLAEVLTTEDRLEIFMTMPIGRTDLTVDLFNKILEDYDADFRVKVD